MKTNIAVLVSGGGTNLQALINAQKDGIITSGEIKLVISNNPDAFALERAQKAGIATIVCNKKELGEKFEDKLIEVLEQNNRIGSRVIRKDIHKNSDNYIRNLLNKMDYAINSKSKTQTSENTLANLSEETAKENERMIDLSGKLDKISAKGKGSLAENYLNSDEEAPSVFSRNITRKGLKPQTTESGFDLEDALNPKEDLDEIMKAFDFFLEEENDTKKKK